jgi:protein-disulfide isomerase
METKKRVVFATGILALLFLLAAFIYQNILPPDPIEINTKGQPTIGTGAIEMVVFEDLRCANCRTFTEEIFPQIISQYVDNGKARLVLILIAFGEQSKPLSNAALAVYKIAQDRFLPFILELLHSKTSGKEEILQVAAKVGGIDLGVLEEKIETHAYYAEIDQNLILARDLMGSDFGTPSLFVNGIETSTDSFQDVVRRVNRIEKGQ